MSVHLTGKPDKPAGTKISVEAAESTAQIGLGGAAEMKFTAHENGVELCVVVDSSSNRLLIKTATFSGARNQLESEALNVFCAIVKGRPFQEAADHGAIYTVEALAHRAAKVPGIRSPRNSGPQFALVERLIRSAHSEARDHLKIGHRENGWYIKASSDWLAKSDAERIDTIKPLIADFLREKSLTDDDIWISQIERAIRVTVAFKETVPYNLKPGLMLALEKKLRAITASPIELFMEELKDANKIRRL